ncbi:unnamed protein product [Rhizoctonia solani]|uniref:Uncharacterized protein n=1 Tax=Rhizoctonia solani TaxID=456999 RepID=A0A8H3A532_9AGAM|nr:unnamed protein product [Rhizoctonia solani]
MNGDSGIEERREVNCFTALREAINSRITGWRPVPSATRIAYTATALSTFQAPDPDSWTSARPSRKPKVAKIVARIDLGVLGVSCGRGGMTGLR